MGTRLPMRSIAQMPWQVWVWAVGFGLVLFAVSAGAFALVGEVGRWAVLGVAVLLFGPFLRWLFPRYGLEHHLRDRNQ